MQTSAFPLSGSWREEVKPSSNALLAAHDISFIRSAPNLEHVVRRPQAVQAVLNLELQHGPARCCACSTVNAGVAGRGWTKTCLDW